MKRKLIISALLIFACLLNADAQADLQLYYDFGKDRNYVSTTFEMFKADKWGDTFIFVDHYYSNAGNRSAGTYSAINGTYFEIERNLNFWADTALGALSARVEYDGSSWGAGILCLGASYFLHSADFKNTASLALMYDVHMGVGSAKVPVKFSGVWGCTDLFGLNGLEFKGFIDVWGNDDPLNDTSFSVLAEPQLWYNLGSLFGCENLYLGTEVELSVNFAGHKGFMCNPCLGTKWVF